MLLQGFIGREIIKVSWAGPTIPNEDGAEDSKKGISTELEGDHETSNDSTSL